MPKEYTIEDALMELIGDIWEQIDKIDNARELAQNALEKATDRVMLERQIREFEKHEG